MAVVSGIKSLVGDYQDEILWCGMAIVSIVTSHLIFPGITPVPDKTQYTGFIDLLANFSARVTKTRIAEFDNIPVEEQTFEFLEIMSFFAVVAILRAFAYCVYIVQAAIVVVQWGGLVMLVAMGLNFAGDCICWLTKQCRGKKPTGKPWTSTQ